MTPQDDIQGGSIQDSVARLLDGELSDEEFAALSQRLREDPDSRQEYFDCISLETHLEHVYAPPLRRGGQDHHAGSLAVRKQAKWALGIAAAAAVVAAAVMGVIQVRNPDPGAVDFQLCGNSRWAVEGGADTRGTRLSPGATLRLEQGVAELNLPHQVRAVVEAPAAIAMVNDRTLRLEHGRGFFEVGSVEGRGFTVVTPRQRLVDLGTAFGVKAGQNAVKLHVFEGRVRVDDAKGVEGEVIEANRSVLLDGPRVEREIEPPSSGFLRSLPPKVEVIFEDDFESGLAPERDYAVLIEPLAIRDLEGNRYPGISDNSSWNFSTGLPHAVNVPVKNPGFEEDGDERSRGAGVAHWKTGGESRGWGVTRQFGNLTPTKGEFFGKLIRNTSFVQELDEVITAGTTYELTVDVGLAEAGAVLRLFGSDRGTDVALAETKVSAAGQEWLKNQTVTYTATEADATGQTLGIVLKRESGRLVGFDRVRLGASGQTRGNELPDGFGVASTEADDGDANHVTSSSPRLLQLHPAKNAKGATPGGGLTMAFDRPIQLGSGRIFLRNITDWSSREIAVGGPRTVVDGRILKISPLLDLADGEWSMGRIGGWASNGWVGVFNPGSEGSWYWHEDLGDGSDARGVLGSMKGPIMATFGENLADASIRREVGLVEANQRYTVSVAIGVRDQGGEVFDGYTIRLRSGDHVFEELSEDLPPGPPNSVTTVGFSWSSSDLPAGLSVGDPLILEISPNQASAENPGYLDFDSLRVTAVGE